MLRIGPIIGSFFYPIFKELFARTFPQLHVFIFGILFILVVLLLPGGLVEMAARVRKLVTTKKVLTRTYWEGLKFWEELTSISSKITPLLDQIFHITDVDLQHLHRGKNSYCIPVDRWYPLQELF